MLQALRTGAPVSAPVVTTQSMSDPSDPVIVALRTGNSVDKTGKPTDTTTPGRSTGTPTGDLLLHEASKFGASAKAGLRSLFDLASGLSLSEVDKRNQQDIASGTWNPTSPDSQAAIGSAEKIGGYVGAIPAKIFDTLSQAINNATDPRTLNRNVDPTGGNPLLADKAGILPGSSGVGASPASTALPTTGTGSTWLGPVVSGATQLGLSVAGARSGTPGSWAPRSPVSVTAIPAQDASLVPSLRQGATQQSAAPLAGPGVGAAAGPSTGPDLTLAPSPPRAVPASSTAPGIGSAAGPSTGPTPDLTLSPSSPRPMLSEPPQPGASLDLSLEPSRPRSLPSGPTGNPTTEPPLTASGLPRGQLWEPADIPSKPGMKIDSEPVAGGLPPEVQASRAAILKRVGLPQARDSALQGDAMSAATDAQMTRFDEPAGVNAKQQFEAEKAALQQHTQGIIQRAGGTVGTDEDTLNARGQTIAAPFDALRSWFEDQRQKVYGAADERAGGAPVTKLEGVDALLQDPTFRNTLLARDQGGLLNSVERQLDEFRKQSPGGFTAQGAEQVRQWLNQVWSNDNRFAVGKLKGAIDDDVMKGAGEDIYGPARKLVQMEHQILDNPRGIAQLFDKDPQTPLNRVTPFTKIPDALTRMDPDQFRNVLHTLNEMPADIQPEAQAAIGEIKGHLVNKLLDAGVNKAPEAQWNSPNVSQAINKNGAKLNIAFGNDAQAVQDIRDLDSAGRILRANPAYPGAAAQAANAMKRGLMTRALQTMSATAGAGLGTAITGGPWGAATGAAIGESIGGKAAQSVGEKAALANWQNRMTKLSDIPK